MYSIIQYTNYRKEVTVSVHGVTASLERAIAFAKECALQNECKYEYMSKRVSDSDADMFSSERYVINQDFDVERHVRSESDPKRGMHIEVEFVLTWETIAASSGAIYDFCNDVRDNMSANNPSQVCSVAGAVTLDDMLQEVLMMNDPLDPEVLRAERELVYRALLAQLEAHGFNMHLLYLNPDDKKTCAQNGTLPAEDKLADISMVRRMLAYMWRQGDAAVQYYMKEFELVEFEHSSEIFAVARAPLLDA